jgi:FkbM family methyltransferase
MAPLTVRSIVKAALRPAREVALSLATYRRGVRRTINGLNIRVDARSRLSFPRTYDTGVTQLLLATLKPGDEAWNVGANVGVHVLQMCARVGPTGRVVAFEPNPRAASLLRRNVALNGYEDRVTIAQIAIGEYRGRSDFFVAGSDPMGRLQRPNPLLRRTTRIDVPVVTLDEFLARRTGVPRCLVIDIEGWEIGALRGAERLLQLNPQPLLIVELHPDAWSWSGHSRDQLLQLMARHNLEAIPLSNQSDVLAEHGQAALTTCRDASPESRHLDAS